MYCKINSYRFFPFENNPTKTYIHRFYGGSMKRIINIFLFVVIGFIFFRPLYAQLMVRASIDGSQAGTQSSGHGVMFGMFSPDFKTLTYQITYSKLQGNFTAAHFHFTPTGGVIHPITFTGNTATGTWDIPDTLLKYFFTNSIYVNIHSSVNPGGEIRGSVIPTQVLFTIAMNGTLAGTQSTALGTGWFRIKDDSVPTLEYNIVFSGLSGPYTGMHIHAKPTETILIPLTSSDSASSVGTLTTYPDSVLKLLVQGNLAVDIHTTVYPAGEISGNITPGGDIPFVAAIDGPQAGTASLGRGTAWAVLRSDLSTIRYSATYAKLQGSYTASHFHTSVGNGVIHPITFTGETSVGQWTGFSDANLQDLLRGRVYLNIHSSVAPGGEIRGTLHYFDKIFTTTLDGVQSGTGSPAEGTAWAYLDQNNDSLAYQVTFNGLTASFTASHFHRAPGGSVVFPLSFPDSATSTGLWTISDSLVPELVRGNIYVNVHSKAFPAGEIRGSFNFASGATISDVSEAQQTIPSSFALEQNYPNPFNPSTTIIYQLAHSGHTSLKIYDLLGRTVATLSEGEQPAGQYRIVFNGHALASGIYFYRLTANNFSEVKKMLLLK
jgi:hypothetical protein